MFLAQLTWFLGAESAAERALFSSTLSILPKWNRVSGSELAENSPGKRRLVF
jgi:hypothetical protein